MSSQVEEGCLLCGLPEADSPPLLFGRFAQPVAATELEWGVDENADGRRVLCVEVPKKVARGAATVDCIFDESLHINGEPCLVDGLSRGTITLQMPPSCPSGDDDGKDAPSGE